MDAKQPTRLSVHLLFGHAEPITLLAMRAIASPSGDLSKRHPAPWGSRRTRRATQSTGWPRFPRGKEGAAWEWEARAEPGQAKKKGD